jgi:hypothetical protein
MIDWRGRGGELHHIELPAFPGVLLPCIFLRDVGLLYFPAAHVSKALGVDDKTQRERVKRDYAEHLEHLEIPTTKGERPMLCIEWEALGAWLVSIGEQNVGEAQRERLRIFKRRVWRAASDILQGKHQAAALPEPSARRSELAGLRTLALQTEARVGNLEEVVYVSEEDTDAVTGTTTRQVRCPECGHDFPVTMRMVSSITVERE